MNLTDVATANFVINVLLLIVGGVTVWFLTMILKRQDKHDEILFGNGQEGLVPRAARHDEMLRRHDDILSGMTDPGLSGFRRRTTDRQR